MVLDPSYRQGHDHGKCFAPGYTGRGAWWGEVVSKVVVHREESSGRGKQQR